VFEAADRAQSEARIVTNATVRDVGPRRGRRTGFTLVELLAVVAIIAVLLMILVPMLRSARLQAVRTTCLSGQRMAMVALNAYAAEYREYPVNIHPDRWAEDWVTWDHPEWSVSGYYDKYDKPPVVKHWRGSEGVPSYWRGYLIALGYVEAPTLGCAVALRSGQSHHTGVGNQVEATNAESLRRNTPFVYLGPGTDPVRTSTYHLGIQVNCSPRFWRSYKFANPFPLLGECCYRIPAVSGRYHFHSGEYYYYDNGEPWWYERPVDMNVAWSDGRAGSHVRDMVPIGSVKLFEYDWRSR